MRNIIILLAILISFSCAKEKETVPEYINYDSEIFTGNDTLIYGHWTFLNSYSAWNGQISWDGPDMIIRPIGIYEYLTKDLTIIQRGKIDTIRTGYNVMINFCSNGYKPASNVQIFYLGFNFHGPDTLVIYLPGGDTWSRYYLRIKESI